MHKNEKKIRPEGGQTQTFTNIDLSPGAGPGFPVEGDARPPGGANIPKKLHESKNILRRRGHRPLHSPLVTP